MQGANPAIDITVAANTRAEGRSPGSQNKEIPRKVLYIAGGALATILFVRLMFGGRVYA